MGAVWRDHDLFFTQPEREGKQALFDVARWPERAGELRQELSPSSCELAKTRDSRRMS